MDSQYSHLAWINTPRKEGGLGGKVNFPLVADLTKKIAIDYDVLIEEAGIALRGLFIINKEGVVVQITKVSDIWFVFPDLWRLIILLSAQNDPPVGRSVDETLRLVQAFQFVEKHGEVCPANWYVGPVLTS